MATKIQIRRGTSSEWTAADPVLANGEWGKEEDTGKVKLGDGVTTWNALAYFSPGDGGGGEVTQAELDDAIATRAPKSNTPYVILQSALGAAVETRPLVADYADGMVIWKLFDKPGTVNGPDDVEELDEVQNISGTAWTT